MSRPKKVPAAILKAIADREKTLRADETGQIHSFYRFRPWPSMPSQTHFLHTESRMALFGGANKIGKSRLLAQKLMNFTIGIDPTRESKRWKPVTDRTLNVWLGCRPKNTRDWLRDFTHIVPPNVEYRAFWARGEERLEFAPTERARKGAVLKIKSYGMGVDEWQKDIVDMIGLDEPPDNPKLFPEIQQRLVMSAGQLCVGATFTEGIPAWFYELCHKLDASFQNAQDGPFMWCRASQYENPLIPREEIDSRRHGMSEDEQLIRIEGQLLLLIGSPYFSSSALADQWKKFVRDPECSLTFTPRGQPIFEAWRDSGRGWKVWERPIVGSSYVVAADTAAGESLASSAVNNRRDSSAAVVLSVDSGEVVATYNDKSIEPYDFATELFSAGMAYNAALLAPEVNNNGAAVLHALRDLGYPKLYRRESFGGRATANENSYGFLTSKTSKLAALSSLAAAIEKGSRDEIGGVILRDGGLLDQLQNFGHLKERRSGSHGLGAITGHDDLVIALAIAYQALSQAPRGTPMNHKVFLKSYAQAIISRMEDDILKDFEARQETERQILSIQD